MELSDKKTFEQFVMEQSPSSPVNHDGGWYTCSVGDYMDVVLGNRELASFHNKELISELLNDEVLEACLNSNGQLVTYDDLLYGEYTSGYGYPRVIHTYGDLQEYFKGNLDIEIPEDEL